MSHFTIKAASVASMLALVTLALAACGGGEPAEQAQPAPETTTETPAPPATEVAATPESGVYRAGAPLGSPDVVALSTVLLHPEEYDGKVVRIEGQIEQVCQKKGCWMILRDGEATARVTFKDYGFFVPMETKPGSVVRIDAEIHRETISEEMAKHYEEETAGGHPEAVEGPQDVVSVVATGVEIDRGEG